MIRGRRFESPFSTDGIARYLKNHVLRSDRFTDLEADLFIVATELNSSRKAVFSKFRSVPSDVQVEYRNDVAVSDACAASMSLPPLYHPYSITVEGFRRDYYDGEIREPLSQHVAREAGCDLIITSYTHQPVKIPQGKKSLADRGVQHVVLQGIYQAIEQKIQAARETRRREKGLVDFIRKFFLEKELPMSLADELIGLVEERMTHKSDLDYIYIAPRSSDFEFFSEPHFSLNRKKTERIVRKGYLSASAALRGITV
jgi:predicted acylesterase/phospholipase RssA